MDRLIAPNTVDAAHADTAPATGTPGYATDGNPATNTPATQWPAYAFNSLQEEILAVILAAGLTPDRTNNAQLLQAIQGVAHIGITAISGLTNANVTLTATQAAKPIISLIGALTGNVQIIFPGQAQQWLVVNNTSGAFTVTCKTASGTGVVIPQGSTMAIYGDGTNIAQGGFALASAAQAQALSSAITLLTPATLAAAFQGGNQTLAQSGFQNLPGGLKLQWFRGSHTAGVNANLTINFPFAFPTAAYIANVTDNSNVSAGAGVYSVSGLVATNLTLFWNYSAVAGGTTNRTPFIFVIGL